MELKVGDFGLAIRYDVDNERRRICGTANYIAPEILNESGHYSYQSDIWSFGVILYTFLMGKTPFDDISEKKIFKKIVNGKYSLENSAQISPEAKDLIKKILVVDPSTRLTLDEIYNHPFFMGNFNVPKLLPTFTLKLAPSRDYINKFSLKLPTAVTTPRENTDTPLASSRLLTNNTWTENTRDSPKFKCNIEVMKWLDYSSKYGLVYLLSNGCIGIYYNDSTKIVVDNEGKFSYIKKRMNNHKASIENYTLSNHPEKLTKKVNILKQLMKNIETNEFQYNEYKELVYVKKWLNIDQGTLFRLSNGIVQLVFDDKSQLILNWDQHEVTYKGKDGIQTNYSLGTALKSDNKEMVHHLKCTMDVFKQILRN